MVGSPRPLIPVWRLALMACVLAGCALPAPVRADEPFPVTFNQPPIHAPLWWWFAPTGVQPQQRTAERLAPLLHLAAQSAENPGGAPPERSLAEHAAAMVAASWRSPIMVRCAAERWPDQPAPVKPAGSKKPSAPPAPVAATWLVEFIAPPNGPWSDLADLHRQIETVCTSLSLKTAAAISDDVQARAVRVRFGPDAGRDRWPEVSASATLNAHRSMAVRGAASGPDSSCEFELFADLNALRQLAPEATDTGPEGRILRLMRLANCRALRIGGRLVPPASVPIGGPSTFTKGRSPGTPAPVYSGPPLLEIDLTWASRSEPLEEVHYARLGEPAWPGDDAVGPPPPGSFVFVARPLVGFGALGGGWGFWLRTAGGLYWAAGPTALANPGQQALSAFSSENAETMRGLTSSLGQFVIVSDGAADASGGLRVFSPCASPTDADDAWAAITTLLGQDAAARHWQLEQPAQRLARSVYLAGPRIGGRPAIAAWVQLPGVERSAARQAASSGEPAGK